jgi:hypothetical protein
MGKNWVIHQCKHPQDVVATGLDGKKHTKRDEWEPEIDAQERADIEQEMRSQHWPDDPDQRDGDGERV